MPQTVAVEVKMKVRIQYWALALLVLWSIASLSINPVGAKQLFIKDEIVGAWSLVTFTAERSDESRTEPFGTNPTGTLIFTPDGHFALFESRNDLPKIAADDPTQATAEEAMAIVRDSIAYYGTYSANEDDQSLSLDIKGSTFANLLGGHQKRLVTSITDSELKLENPERPSGIALQTVWKRADPER
jgi:hypothetical protein